VTQPWISLEAVSTVAPLVVVGAPMSVLATMVTQVRIDFCESRPFGLPRSSQDLQSVELVSRNSLCPVRVGLFAAPICTFRGLMDRAPLVRERQNGRNPEWGHRALAEMRYR
jgi:hypothetical protein